MDQIPDRARRQALASLLAGAAGAAAGAGCASVPAPVKRWGTCVDLSVDPQKVFDDVSAALRQLEWAAAVAAIAKDVGWAAVDCALQTILDKTAARRREGTMSAENEQVATRAQAIKDIRTGGQK